MLSKCFGWRKTLFFLSFLIGAAAYSVEPAHNISSLNVYETATNQNYKVSIDGKSLVFRVGRENPEQLGIDRETEVEHYQIAERIGLAPKLYAYQLTNGMLVTEFVEGSCPSESRVHESDFLEKLISNLKILHTCSHKVGASANHSVFAHNDMLIRQLRELEDGLGENSRLDSWLRVRESFEQGHYDEISLGVCHGDLYRGNMLERPDGTLVLIDWEYTYYGPVIDDVGSLCAANWLDDTQIAYVLDLYWGDATPEMVRRVKQNVFMKQLNLYAWCKVQASHNPGSAGNYLLLASKAAAHLDQLADDVSS